MPRDKGRNTIMSGQSAPAYRQSVEGCLEAAIGHRGLSENSYRLWLARVSSYIEDLKADYASGALPLLRVPEETADIADARAAMQALCPGARTIVFSVPAVQASVVKPWCIFLAGICPMRAAPKRMARPLYGFIPILMPIRLNTAWAQLDVHSTRFVLISKSGGTVETLMQAMAALQAVKAAGLEADIPKLFLGLTEPAVPGKVNGLRRICETHGIPLLDHNPGVGGRYSGLTNVGLLPALARGMDVEALRQGAQDVVEKNAGRPAPRGSRTGHRRGGGGGARQGQGHSFNGAYALCRPVRAPVAMVCTAVGGILGQDGAGHHSHRCARAR